MKIQIFIYLVAVSLIVAQSEKESFQAYKVNNIKNYRSQAEETRRFNIFRDNVRAIEEHNALYEQGLSSYKQGVNKFTDMTQEEFKSMLTLSSSQKPHFNATKHVKTGLVAPDSIDWRTKGQVTGVKDQAMCGSCWAFSITGATEAAYYRKSGKLVSLSEQQLVDCSTAINDGCSGGYIDETFPYVEQYGLESEESYPYTGNDGNCKYSASKVVTKISSYISITTEDEDALLDVLGTTGPVSVAMNALSLSSYTSGIFDDKSCDPQILDHAVLVVGYGSEAGKDFWIVKNSWGLSWGEQGYFRILRGCNECGIAEDAAYPSCN